MYHCLRTVRAANGLVMRSMDVLLAFPGILLGRGVRPPTPE
jgi:hypothetical protein